MHPFLRLLRPMNLLLLAGLILSVFAVTAFAASNTGLVERGAGGGVGTVSGYSISNVVWTLDGDAPNAVNSVAFSVSPSGGAAAAAEVYVTIDGGSTWVACGGGPPNWSCNLGGVAASTIEGGTLRIVTVE